MSNDRLVYFNLNNDGDSAIVRLLHSGVSTIEKTVLHRVVTNEAVGQKTRRVKCLLDDCPLCRANCKQENRIYIHLFDYTDNTEKVWERTDKILQQLQDVQASWGALNTAVIKITRVGNEFPKYKLDVLNPTLYANVECPIDTKISALYSMSRKKDEIEEYIRTGKFPERKPYVPKSEYSANSGSSSNAPFNPMASTTVVGAEQSISANVESATSVPSLDNVGDNPFMGSFVPPRKV